MGVGRVRPTDRVGSWTHELIARAMADTLIKESSILRDAIAIGGRSYPIHRAQHDRKIQYNHESFNFLGQSQEYVLSLPDTDLLLSLQLYFNANEHYRLFIYCDRGMLFSINLTILFREPANGSPIRDTDIFASLQQRLKLFNRKPDGVDKEAFDGYKSGRVAELESAVRALGVDVTNREANLGVYYPALAKFERPNGQTLRTADFVTQLLALSVIKGHFMDNKGYRLEGFTEAPEWLHVAPKNA
jgi:hypothetical protein